MRERGGDRVCNCVRERMCEYESDAPSIPPSLITPASFPSPPSHPPPSLLPNPYTTTLPVSTRPFRPLFTHDIRSPLTTGKNRHLLDISPPRCGWRSLSPSLFISFSPLLYFFFLSSSPRLLCRDRALPREEYFRISFVRMKK